MLYDLIPYKQAQAKMMHIQNFDALRLIFAFMVVLFHIGILSNSTTLAWLTRISATFAVQAFFFVSGFLVVMSYVQSSSIKSYAMKRIRRIFPAYILIVLAAAILLATISRLDYIDYFLSKDFLNYVMYNLLLSNFNAPSLPGVFESNVETAVNASLWTIKIEVAFYCLVPFIVLAIKRWNYHLVLVSLIVASIAWRLGFELGGNYLDNEFFYKLAKQLPGQLSFFAAGAYAYFRTVHGLKSPNLIMALSATLFYIIFEGWVFQLISPMCVGIIVYWLAVSAPKLWSPSRYGDFSYGIYLFHFPLVQVIVSFGCFTSRPYVSLFFSALLLISMAIISWFFVERPFIRGKGMRG